MKLQEIPKNPILVSQSQLRQMTALVNAIQKLKNEVSKRRDQILADLIAGGSVEEGVHMAVIEAQLRNGKQVRKLVVR